MTELKVLDQVTGIHQEIGRLLRSPPENLFFEPIDLQFVEGSLGRFLSNADTSTIQIGVFPGSSFQNAHNNRNEETLHRDQKNTNRA